jgi:hypothetical protein
MPCTTHGKLKPCPDCVAMNRATAAYPNPPSVVIANYPFGKPPISGNDRNAASSHLILETARETETAPFATTNRAARSRKSRIVQRKVAARMRPQDYRLRRSKQQCVETERL